MAVGGQGQPSAGRRGRRFLASGLLSIALLLGGGLIAPQPALAVKNYEASLVKDLDPSGSGNPQYLTDVGGTLFFTLPNSSELWKSDGTEDGTTLAEAFSSISGLVEFDGLLFFAADDGSGSGSELWKSDGTEDGTEQVADINPGSGSSGPTYLTPVGDTLFFRARDDSGGYELWKSDGSAEGTELVEDVFPGSSSGDPRDLVEIDGTLFFRAVDGVSGAELWKSDGTEAGTSLVKDINPGADAGHPAHFAEFEGDVYFSANAGSGAELWKSDGTEAGTVLVKDVASNSYGGRPEEMTEVDGALYFSASDSYSSSWRSFSGHDNRELWKSDGTAAGTEKVTEIRSGADGSSPAELIEVGGQLYFVATDVVYDAYYGYDVNRELWKSDGSEAGTQMVKDIYPGRDGSSPRGLTEFEGTLFFSAESTGAGTYGRELWKSDGTEPGSRIVEDISVGHSSPRSMTVVGETLFFVADDGATGAELWKATKAPPEITIDDVSVSEGDAGKVRGTFTVSLNAEGRNPIEVDFATADGSATEPDDYEATSGSRSFAVGETSKQVTVNVEGDTVDEVDQTFEVGLSNLTNAMLADGSGTGTIVDDDALPGLAVSQVKDLNPGAGSGSPTAFAEIDGTIYFNGNDGASGAELWKSDGTARGTEMVKDIWTGGGGSYPTQLVAIGDTLYFRASDNNGNGTELWRSDGTEDGTQLVEDINPGSFSSNLTGLTSVGEALFFTADDGTNGRELWTSDGTAEGTELVKNSTPGSAGSSLWEPTSFNGGFFFTVDDGISGRELWKSDGTPAGTSLVKDILPGAGSATPNNLTVVGDALFFAANDGAAGPELWRSDGTAAGTTMVKDIRPGASGSGPGQLTEVGGSLMFRASDNAGLRLWKSDGTEGGTETLGGPSGLYGLTDVGGTLYFRDCDGGLWRSDGTTGGTELVKDIADGCGGGPNNITGAGNKTFFTIDDGTHGSELWASTGTEAGTELVADIQPGSAGSGPANLIEVSGNLFFSADDGADGRELWKAITDTLPPDSTIDSGPDTGSATKDDTPELVFSSSEPGSTFECQVDAGGFSDCTSPHEIGPLSLGEHTFEVRATDGAGNTDPTPASRTFTVVEPELSIDDAATVAEGDGGQVDATFTVTLDQAISKPVSVELDTADDTASAGSDYDALSGETVSFAAGETSKQVTVKVNGDAVDEPDETFEATLSNPLNAAIGDGTGLGTITDDDPAPELSVGNPAVTEGNSGHSDATFTISLDVASEKTIGVDFATADDTATEPGDYEATSGSRSFAPGETTKQVTVKVEGDTVDEVDEEFGLELSSASNATIGDGTGVGTIADDDDPPALSIDDVGVTEGDTGQVDATFTVSLGAASEKTVGVDYATADDTATEPSDYEATSGSRSFAPGETIKQVTVKVAGDALDEVEEGFEVNLSNASNATIGGGTGVGTIGDDDSPPQVSVDDVSVTEGDSGQVDADFEVSLDAPSGRPVSVDYATGDDTAAEPEDYAASSGTVSFAPGETVKNVSVGIEGDTTDELDETFDVALSSPSNATVGDGTGVGTIADDDDPPVLSIDDIGVTEGDTGQVDATFTISLDAASGKTIGVDFATADDTATEPGDYEAASGSRTFAPGETSKQVTVKVAGDELDEVAETFEANLSNPSNATIGDGTAVGTISDDDPSPELSIGDVSVNEGDSGQADATFTISLDAASGRQVSVDWATADGTAGDPADYEANSGTATFAAGEISKQITVKVAGDALDEPDEDFSVELSSPTGADIGDGTGTGTIIDNDPEQQVSINDVTVTEGDAGQADATFTVSLDAASGKAVQVDFATADDTAGEPGDYERNSGSESFAPGETIKQITVKVEGDELDEADEQFSVELSNASGASIDDDTGTGTITDDDDPPALTIVGDTVAEGDTGTTDATFTVTLNAPSGREVSVEHATADGTATEPVDYASENGTTTFAPGDTSKEITVEVAGDEIEEPNEDFTVGLSTPANATIAVATGTGQITNDDPTPGISIDDTGVDEGDTGQSPATFAVSLSNPTQNPVSVELATADGTATEPSDYEAKAKTVDFAPGESEQTVNVQVVGDELDEPDEELIAGLSSPTNASIADGEGVAAIADDDDPPALAIDDVAVDEGDSGTTDATFTVSLDAPSAKEVEVDLATADGTAAAADDYEAKSASRTFSPGETAKQLTVEVSGDTVDEPDESYEVGLSNAQKATIDDGTGTGTIVDDDEAAEDPPGDDGGGGPIEGTPGNDVLEGTTGDDVIVAGGGDDVIKGRGGSDVIVGGGGDDVINGGADDDLIVGGGNVGAAAEGAAVVSGEAAGGSDRDTLKGGVGADVIRGGPDRDVLRGKVGSDRLIGGAGKDVLKGNAGRDRLEGRIGKDVLKGGGAEDELAAGGGHDQLYGGPGADFLDGAFGRDLLIGNGDDDTLEGGGGRDIGRGGPGDDVLKGQGGRRDAMRGQGGEDELAGGAGRDDLCHGGGGADTAKRSCERIRRVP